MNNLDNLTLFTEREDDELEKEQELQYVLTYRKTFAQKGRELVADVRYSDSVEDEGSGRQTWGVWWLSYSRWSDVKSAKLSLVFNVKRGQNGELIIYKYKSKTILRNLNYLFVKLLSKTMCLLLIKAVLSQNPTGSGLCIFSAKVCVLMVQFRIVR